MRMRGYINKTPFPPPQFINPITSQPIVAAVLYPYSQTYNHSSIEQYIQQHHSCPMAGHPLRRKDLYVNEIAWHKEKKCIV
jgi:U-box domain